MSSRIDGSSGNIQSLQWMQAQRAFGGANKTESKQFQEISLEDIYESDFSKGSVAGFEPSIDEMPDTQSAQQVNPSRNKQNSNNGNNAQPMQSALPFEDIKSIAEQAGFIGISNRDIQRAYALGESLLADYKV